MRFRKLRIALSALFGIACVLLIALWVRSYSWQVRIVIGLYGKHGMQISHVAGQLRLTLFNEPGLSYWQPENSPYGREKMSVEEWRATTNPEVTSTSPSFLVARVPIGSTLHNGWTLHTPYWFIVSFVSMLAAAPWLRWQFSLRTLLIATTLVSAVLGLAVALGW